MKVLVLENDSSIPDKLANYLVANKLEADVIYMADQTDTLEIMEKFGQFELLIFQPNMVTVSQYDMMLMLMYDLLTRDKLAIKRVELMYPSDRIVGDLKSVWEHKRKYLDKVLEVVEIYRIDSYTKEKTRIEL